MAGNKYLLVKGISGLGNRIECLLTAILYARLSGRRLVVDWSDHYYSNDGTNVFHHYFQCALCDPHDDFPQTDSVIPIVWRGRLRDSAWKLRRERANDKLNPSDIWREFSIDLTKLDYSEDIAVMWTYQEQLDLLRRHFVGSYQELAALGNREILRKLLHENLRLQPGILDRVNEYRSSALQARSVGVHVRYTDHRTRLLATLHKLNLLLKRENLAILLCTDNVQVKRIFESNYPRVITTAHWYAPTPGLAIHTAQSRSNPMETGRDALIDLYLLAECDYLIVDTTSSFARIAVLLKAVPDTNIYDVGVGDKQPARVRRITHRLLLKAGFFSWGLGLVSQLMKLRRLHSARCLH